MVFLPVTAELLLEKHFYKIAASLLAGVASSYYTLEGGPFP
jgi:hypothetical protein